MNLPDVRTRTLEGAVFKSPTKVGCGQSAAAACMEVLRRLGTGWQDGQKYDERFMNATLRIGVLHRSQGSPSRP